jgi:peptidoglycan/LPS O-acetylase OafA/YrhL
MLALPFALPNLNVKAAVAVLAMVQSWTDGISEFGKSWMTPAWTLSVECFFYLFFPFLITVLRRLQIPALLALCAIDTIFMISGGTSTVQPGTDYAHVPNWSLHLFLPLTRSSEFVFGMLLHTLSTRAQGLARGHGTAPCLLLTATVVVLLSITANDRVIGVAAVLVGLLIGLIYVSDNGFTRLLGWRPIYVLGGASYALYLLQSPVHAYLVLLFDSFGRILAFPVTLGASLLVWRFVEEPARRSILRHRAGAVARAPVAN